MSITTITTTGTTSAAPRRQAKRTLRESVRQFAARIRATGDAALQPSRSVPPRRAGVVDLADRRGTAGLDVLIVTSEAPPIVSGISRCVDRLTGGLRERGHRVDVLSSVQIPRLMLGEYRFSAMVAYWRQISRLLADYDVVNLHGPVPTMSDVFLLLAGARRGTPIVYTHHSALAVRGAETLCKLYNRIHRFLSGRADAILTTSEHYAALERRAGGPQVEVVPWGVDVRPLPVRPKTTEKPLQVLFVGQMRPYKGLEWLIPAVAGRPELELTLVGDGPHRGDYERLAAELGATNIHFVGRVSDEELHAAYDRSDVVTLPSVTQAEAFGLVVLEGMAAGAVPVVSDLPGVRDLVSGVGVVVPPKDVDSLRDALLALADDRSRLRAASRRARAKAESLSWDACVERYETVMADALARRGRAPRRAGRPASAMRLVSTGVEGTG